MYLEGKINNYDSGINGIGDFIVRDNNGQVLLTESTCGIIDIDRSFNYGFKILSDLSQREYNFR